MPRVLDPRLFTAKIPKDVILFACASGGSTKTHLVYFNDECFVLADGLASVPHADVASQLASETVLWGYKQIRLRHTYWADKTSLIRRIFRTTNLTIWQKHREPGFGDGLATSLLVAIVGPRAVWIGNAGTSSAFFFKNGQLIRLTRQDTDEKGKVTKALGFVRLGLAAQNIHQKFVPPDTLLLVNDGITHALDPRALALLLKDVGTTQERLSETARKIMVKAQKDGGGENLAVCLIKRVASLR